MIHEVEGDILKTDAEALVHGVAPNDDFKKGLAMSVKEQWPSLYKDFRHFCHTKHPESGSLWSWAGVGGKQKYVIQLFTQEGHYEKGGRPGKATVHNLHNCLKKLKDFVKSEGIKSLAIPMVATGIGGLKADEVRPLIEEELKELDIPIYFYTHYKKEA